MATFQTTDGLSLYYEEQGNGSGTPILCIPGLTRDGQDFRYLLPQLGARRVICLDQRGRGRSEYAEDPMTYSVLQEAEDVVTLLDHLNAAQATIIGTSRGGLVAMALAGTARERLAGVVLNDVGPDIDPAGMARIFDYLGRRPAAKTHADAAAALDKALGQEFPGLDPARWLEDAQTFYAQTETGLELRYDPRLRDALLAQAADIAAMETPPSLWPWFEALDGLPCASIRGAFSDILSAETFAKMKSRLPQMHAVELPDRGHVPYLDEAPALAAINAVLTEVDARSSLHTET